jgi:hypothetical protein
MLQMPDALWKVMCKGLHSCTAGKKTLPILMESTTEWYAFTCASPKALIDIFLHSTPVGELNRRAATNVVRAEIPRKEWLALDTAADFMRLRIEGVEKLPALARLRDAYQPHPPNCFRMPIRAMRTLTAWMGRYPRARFNADTCPYLTMQLAEYKKKEEESYSYFLKAVEVMVDVLTEMGISLDEEVEICMPQEVSDRMRVRYKNSAITYTVLAVPPV